MITKVLLVFSLILVIFVVTGCQTVQGVGRDLTWTGQAGAEVLDELFEKPEDQSQASGHDRRSSRYDY